MLIFVDIDGTLADISSRAKRAGAQPSRKDKVAFQFWLDRLQKPKALAKDLPIAGVIWLVNLMASCPHEESKIIYLTGRAEKYRKVTQSWLDRAGCPKGPLYMRPNKNWQTAVKYKEGLMLDLVKEYSKQGVLILDDDGDGNCAKMYKKHGWLHLKVMWNV